MSPKKEVRDMEEVIIEQESDKENICNKSFEAIVRLLKQVFLLKILFHLFISLKQHRLPRDILRCPKDVLHVRISPKISPGS